VPTWGRAILVAPAIWGLAALCFHLHANRATTSMALILAVLGVAALGEWLPAVICSMAAGLALSWYFIDTPGSLRLSTTEGWVTFCALLFTALGGSRLAVDARRRADEAELRRRDMERLQRLGQALLMCTTVTEVAQCAASRVVELFNVTGAEIKGEGVSAPVRAGFFGEAPERVSAVPLDLSGNGNVLEIHGRPPSREVLSALGHFIGLALGRARGLEEHGRRESERRAEELRTIVLNGLAHGLRTPLTSIKLAASALRHGSGIAERIGMEMAQVIEEEADRLEKMIGESLQFARIESHRVNPRIEACSLREITEKVISRLARYLAGRELVIDVRDDLPPVRGDRFLLERMLFEVVDNAWKYSRPGSRIGIEAVARENIVSLTVRSHGDEIAHNERELIFAKFYRGAVHRSLIEGTGVGLAIARAIAEAHQGEIRLESEPGGHAFRFSLPTGK
jgi:two-component system sensor histidine kinase KdpD